MLYALKTKCAYVLLLLSLFVGSQSFADIHDYQQSDVTQLDEMPLEYDDLWVTEIKTKSVWLNHGLWDAIGSAVTGFLSNMALTHHWAEIRTNVDNVWFVAQFAPTYSGKKSNFKNRIQMIHVRDPYHGDMYGQRGCSRGNDNCKISAKRTTDVHDVPFSYLYNWVWKMSRRAGYSFVHHNCQDFADEVHDIVRDDEKVRKHKVRRMERFERERAARGINVKIEWVD